MKSLILSALLLAAPLAVPAHDMNNMTDLAKKAASYCLIVNRDSGDVNLYEIATAKNNRIFLDKFSAPHMGMISPDGRTLVVSGSGNNTIYLIDMQTMKIRAKIKAFGEPEHMDITPDSKYVFCGSMEGGVVQAIDLSTDQPGQEHRGLP